MRVRIPPPPLNRAFLVRAHKTVFGAWSVRARPGAQVSTPVTWHEIDTLHPDDLTIASVPERLTAHGNPWEQMGERPPVARAAARAP